MKFLKAFCKRLINIVLNKSSIIRDMILALDNLTRAVRDLTRANLALAKMQAEDRAAIVELYEISAEFILSPNDVNTIAVAPEKPKQLPAKLTPIEQIAFEKKKNTIN